MVTVPNYQVRDSYHFLSANGEAVCAHEGSSEADSD